MFLSHSNLALYYRLHLLHLAPIVSAVPTTQLALRIELTIIEEISLFLELRNMWANHFSHEGKVSAQAYHDSLQISWEPCSFVF